MGRVRWTLGMFAVPPAGIGSEGREELRCAARRQSDVPAVLGCRLHGVGGGMTAHHAPRPHPPRHGGRCRRPDRGSVRFVDVVVGESFGGMIGRPDG